jgi:hypothetical protein
MYGSSLVRSLSSRIASITLGSFVFAVVSSFAHAQVFADRRPGIDAVQVAVQASTLPADRESPMNRAPPIRDFGCLTRSSKRPPASEIC